MDLYVFRLIDRMTKAYAGVVVIFDAEMQQVWRRFRTDEHAVRVDYAVARNEAERLRGELRGLKTETEITPGPSVLQANIMTDREVTGDHRPTFVEQDSVRFIALPEDVQRSRVDGSYEKLYNWLESREAL